jgi:IMP cyclohydrolase-like protein
VYSLFDEIASNPYPGRGIVLGQSPDKNHAVAVYFIMGRSENSRNRIFISEKDGIITKPFDEKKVTDPSLIFYQPVKILGNKTIITNGDHTDAIYKGMDQQLTFEQCLRNCSFEPDAPNYTPRISGIIKIDATGQHYAMSILKSDNGSPDSCQRFTFAYDNPTPGYGHFIHTYIGDSNPLKSFCGEPKKISILDDIDLFADKIWKNLNEENKISLWVRYINIKNLEYKDIIINKNK